MTDVSPPVWIVFSPLSVGGVRLSGFEQAPINITPTRVPHTFPRLRDFIDCNSSGRDLGQYAPIKQFYAFPSRRQPVFFVS